MKVLYWIILSFMILISCSQGPDHQVDLQGHRGARGLVPENTIPGFIKAIQLDVSTLEMDLSVTKNGQLVLSHDPYISAEICLNLNGNKIEDSLQYHLRIYEMTYEEVAGFDCGSKPHPHFPEQVKRSLAKPLLSTVLDTVEAYLDQYKLPDINYNIELKSWSAYDEVLHPTPPAFSDLVFEMIDGKVDWDRVTIQSFDFRVLQYFHERYPKVRLSLLIENELTYQENLDSLGFLPEIYSVDYNLLDRGTIDALHSLGIQVIPWTINTDEEMQRLISWGVDGIITDYPNRYPYK